MSWDSVNEIVQERVRRFHDTLVKHRGNRAAACRELGINSKTAQNYLRIIRSTWTNYSYYCMRKVIDRKTSEREDYIARRYGNE